MGARGNPGFFLFSREQVSKGLGVRRDNRPRLN